MNEYSYQQGRPPHQHRDHPEASVTYDGNTYHYSSVKTNAGLAQSSYDFNRGAIPGLALGFSGGNHIAQGQGGLSVSVNDQTEPGNVAAPIATAQDDDLSEGELEDDDIYEPSADDKDGPPTNLRAAELEQERVASYSPAFSAGEVNESPDSQPSPASKAFASDIRPSPNESATQHAMRQMSAADQVRKVREDACAAISNLCLFDLPQQTYLDHNIDKSVLESLFRELGLDLPSQDQIRSTRATATATKAQLSPKPKATAQVKAASIPSRDPSATSSKPSPSKDGSESRKDRIARLLAAKGSRQASVSHTADSVAPDESAGKETDTGARSDLIPTEPPASLPNQPSARSLEKSKLLQQKMEALRKAREAKALSSAQPDAAEQLVQKPASDIAAAPANNTIVQPELASISKSSSSHFPAGPRGQGIKRPVASDFDGPSFTSSKRPYGQAQEARQFLIHVSDDEDDSDDDTEMDIETPEERSLPSAAAAVESTLLRNHPPLSDSPYRGTQSPANTPGRPKSIIGSENLSKMYRNIEEMKRRIKEAEASKQAKTSRSGTPQDTAAKPNAEHDLPSPAAIREAVSRASPASSAAGSTPRETPPATTSNGASPQARPGPRRSLSRTAQERLTSIESERKNKELKMRIMRAKIAQMEREMAASLQEEEALYDQGDDEDVDDNMTGKGATIDDDAQSDDQTPVQPAASKAEPLSGNPEVAEVLPSHLARPASIVEAEAETTDSLQNTPTKVDTGLVPEVIAQQSAEEPDESSQEADESSEEADESSEDDDAEMKDLTDAENSDSESNDDRTSEAESLNDDMSADAHAASVDSKGANDDDEDQESASESDPADEEADSDQGALDGGISHEVYPIKAQVGKSHADIWQESDGAHSEAAGQHEGQSQETEPAGQTDAEIPTAVEQTSDIDELMGVKQPLNLAKPTDNAAEPIGGFRPYQSPLSYFHAYRFHPEFQKAVKGGLRSLTYSNKIDVQKPMCPDELAGGECPRGPRCNFQHLGKINTPDDQILMQLGSYGAGEGDEQERFNNGLRTLLQELKSRESQDFAAISQAIIDYRAQFHGDKSKILPLGNVSI